MFAIELRSFGFITPKTWVTLADVRFFFINLRSFGCIAPKTWETLADVRYRA